MRIYERAYAKINLCLDVTGRRENGYHEIDGVMQSVTLCDEIAVSFEESDCTEITLTAEGNSSMPTDVPRRDADLYQGGLRNVAGPLR